MKIFGLLALAILSALLYVLHIGGVFDRLVLSHTTAGPFILVYRFEREPYDEMKFVVNDVGRYLRSAHSVHASRGFAIFYDNPGRSWKGALRSIAGCIIDSSVTVAPPYLTAVYPRTDAVAGTFPIRSFFSYTTGLFKFSSQLENFTEKNGLKVSGPLMEVYDLKNKMIHYVVPVGGGPSPAPALPPK